ncbi:Vms1/Ankzf1 family peptidyl-tRNA hydrolase [Specibacter sp. NPDC057265]|uniref:baeRF2 domain-containing protein n=1 Tax=Specibacter sp. NPDC057265 TaxID=3346075 RepID=UPI0036288989
MTDSLKEYADLYRHEGPWSVAYIEADTGTVDTLEAADVRPGHVRETLAAKGAPKPDLDAVEEAVQPATGEPSPVARYILARQGKVELNVLLPGPLVVPERISVDPIPDLLPLVRHRPSEYPYLVVEAGRDDAEIRLHYAGKHSPDHVQKVQGSDENLKKVPSGGWSQGRYQHRTEEIWRRNANQVAEEIDRIIRSSGAKLLVLAGDIRARGLIQDQLSEASRELLSVVDSHTHTGGADQEAFNHQINERVALQWAAEQQEVLDRLAVQQGQANPESTTGAGAVVHALQQAQVEVLIMNDQAFADREFLALSAEPWIATAQEEALGADVLGKVPATAALLRAAALTDARILLVPEGVLPDKTDIAALLRWPTGPAAPSA